MSAIPRQDVPWDVRRNTSMVHPVRPGAWRDAVSALRNWGDANWKHREWIVAGYPNLTEEEHREWFSSDYAKARSKRRT